MVAMNLPGASVATVASTVREKFGSEHKPGSYPDYGLSARFDVVVDNRKIGSWASCGGLGIAFDPQEVKAGGRYDQPAFTPGRMSWGEVTLERALDRQTHDKFNKMLQEYTKSWVNWTGGGSAPSYPDKTVVITMLAASGNVPIATWTLHNALIKSWSGPTLAGGKNEVATEKLVFVHSGFWENARACPTIRLEHATKPEFLLFEHFPEKYNISQSIQTNDKSGLKPVENHVTKIIDRKISLNNLRVSGAAKVEAAVNQLFGWLVPEEFSSRAGSASGGTRTTANAKVKPTELQLTMGQERGLVKVAVGLREVKVDFTRFNANGSPICAEIDLTLIQTPPRQPFLNPTSGGRTANGAHLVSAGDNLQRIAQDTYHNPNAWRMIAATNDIDDPLRVRIGNSLLLPGTAE
ncbi:MAG TPA: phage tail protein [Pseudonocardiaceae bacterium]|nr:phage tail protein [Pseudonocardiaceae bacterium]